MIPRFIPQHIKIAVPTVLLVWSLAYLTTSKSTYSNFLRSFQDERKLFIDDFLNNEIDGSFDGSGIKALCASKTWTKGLVLTCDPSHGGLGEVKNGMLHCVRIAIELGAELIVPQIVTAAEAKITTPGGKLPNRGTPMDYFFDSHHFNQTLSTYCPQMKLHESIDQFHNVPEIGQIHKLSLLTIAPERIHGTVLAKPADLGPSLQKWLEETAPAKTRRYPFRVHLDTPKFVFPVASDPDAFAKNFGRIIRTRPDCRQLAAAALFNLAKTFGLSLDPRRGIKADSFAGVHMPTEKGPNGQASPYPEYPDQAADYLNFIAANKVRVVFLAAGTAAADEEGFIKRASEFNATVVHKRDVLEGADLLALGELNEEQKGLVDYEIMLRAGLVTGTASSSFAWNLAMRRKNAYADGVPKEQLADSISGDIAWQDAFSTVYGKSITAEAYEHAIWP